MVSALEKNIHRYFLLNHPFYHTSIDKYFKWIPFATVFLLDLLGVRTRSGWRKQALIAGAAEALRYTSTDNLKKLTHERRPAPYTGNHSFPSGHTSSSFAGAEFMRMELKNSIPVLSWVGYMAAITTATTRLIKNRHWLKDVIAGAAIGIVSVRLSFFIVNNIKKKK